MLSLDEVLVTGRGTERPFRCHEHEDHNASATVNVVKGVWFCHACHASGRLDGKKAAPSAADLMAMMTPEIVRTYPETYLDLFDAPGGYWDLRMGAVARYHRCGEDPFTGEPVYPVRDESGQLLGITRRALGDEQPKYRYPRGWSASRTMFGYPYDPEVFDATVVVIGEGAADGMGVQRAGILGLAAYGAGLHAPQRELLARIAPRLVILGFDNDEAGERATLWTRKLVQDLCATVTVEWPDKDPATSAPKLIEEVIAAAVGPSMYRSLRTRWAKTRSRLEKT